MIKKTPIYLVSGPLGMPRFFSYSLKAARKTIENLTFSIGWEAVIYKMWPNSFDNPLLVEEYILDDNTNRYTKREVKNVEV